MNLARVRAHLALVGKGAFAIGGAGGVVGVYGVAQLVQHGVKHSSGWMWLALCFLVLFLAQIRAVQAALAMAEGRSAGVTQTAVSMAAGATVPGNISLDRIQMSAGQLPMVSKPKRRRFDRRLSDTERINLADRCENCSKEVLGWLFRPEPITAWTGTEEERAASERAREEHKSETERVFQSQHVARIRDLLNECAEAGYSLSSGLEVVRTGSAQIEWHNRQAIAEELGVVARRVRRGAKRLAR